MTILDQIDRVTSGLCPCGAPPAAGSAYCSDDCRPTHISYDTDIRVSGDLATPMRWRPDLVTEADDSDLIPLGSETHGYTGRFNAQVYERLSNPTVWHLRLDDGHRHVGCDLADVGGRQDPITVELVGRIHEAWRRLERDLTDPRHAAPIDRDPWPELLENHYAECGRRTAAAIEAFVEAVRPAMRVAAEAASAVAEGLAAAGLVQPSPSEDPMEHALHRRRNRNTGPTPDRLDGRRRRR